MIVTIKHELSTRLVADLIVTAFEGGSNYWIDRGEYDDEVLVNELCHSPTYDCPEYWDRGGAMSLYADDEPDVEPDLHLSLVTIQAALNNDELANGIKARIVAEDYDANDADVVIQFAVFGEIVYG
jgi:hypothetical protein